MRALLVATLLALPALSRADALPGRVAAAKVAALNAERETVRGPVEATLLIPRSDEEAADPREHIPFTCQCAVYTPEPGELVRRFAVHVQDRTMLPVARRAARFLAILWGLSEKRFGHACSRLRLETVDVWMTRHGDAGGELERNNLYIYNLVSDDRSGIEWARELAHEYGHYLLPAASGYTEPESWANGMLGERLFLNWLWQELTSDNIIPDEVPFVRTTDLADYRAKQVVPLIERIEQLGPEPDTLARTDKTGMNAFTGVMLYADAVYGSLTLMDMLDGLPRDAARHVRGPDFLTALTVWLGQAQKLTITLPASGTSRVYLPGGELKLQSACVLSLDGKPLTREGAAWSARVAAGWHTLSATGGKPPVVVKVERR